MTIIQMDFSTELLIRLRYQIIRPPWQQTTQSPLLRSSSHAVNDVVNSKDKARKRTRKEERGNRDQQKSTT